MTSLFDQKYDSNDTTLSNLGVHKELDVPFVTLSLAGSWYWCNRVRQCRPGLPTFLDHPLQEVIHLEDTSIHAFKSQNSRLLVIILGDPWNNWTREHHYEVLVHHRGYHIAVPNMQPLQSPKICLLPKESWISQAEEDRSDWYRD